MNRFTLPRSFFSWLSILLLLTPVFIYGYIVSASLVNFPYYDDFFWYNKLIIQAKGQPFFTQLGLTVQQHSDHRLIFLKGTALLLAYLGPFDFRWPILLTNALFLLLSVHLVIHIYRITRNWFFAVPCLFILFQFQPFTVAFSYGPQTLGVLLFVYFAFYYVWQTDKKAYFLTGLSVIFCVLTNTNGLFVLPIIVALYGLTHRFRAALIWALLTVVVYGVYFSGDYQWNVGTVSDVPTTNPLVHYYLFLVELLGSWANSNPRFGYFLAVGIGSLMLFCIIGLLIRLVQQMDWKRWYIAPVFSPADQKRQLLLTATCLLGFILLTCLLLTYKRYGGTETANNVVPHYRQYSMFALCFVYVSGLLLILSHRAQLIYAFVCASVAIVGNVAILLYVHQDLRWYTLSIRADAYNIQANQAMLFFPIIEGKAAWKTITAEMLSSYSKQYIANPPAPKPTRLIPGLLHVDTSESLDGTMLTLSDSTRTLPYIRNAFVVLQNANHIFYLPFVNYINSPRTVLRKQALFQNQGYTIIRRYIPRFALPAGKYQAYLLDENEGTRQRIDQLIDVGR